MLLEFKIRMKTLTVLVILAFGFTLICTSNGIYVFGSRRRRSTVQRTPNLDHGEVKTPNVTVLVYRNGLNATDRPCNDSSCPQLIIDSHKEPSVALPNQNGTIIKQIIAALNKPEYLCLAYDQFLPAVRRYDPLAQICCNGIFNRTRPNERCCDGRIIDGDNATCCGGSPIPLSDTTVGCCNGTVYETNSTHCCKGTTFQKTNYSACCGDRVISEISEICCSERTFTKTSGYEKCCGDVSFVERVSVCCDKRVQPVIGRYNKHGSCCGPVNYDTRCFTCNVASVVVAIANSTLNGTCCPGKVVEYNGRKVCCMNGTTEGICRLNEATLITPFKGSFKILIGVVTFGALVSFAVAIVLFIALRKLCKKSLACTKKGHDTSEIALIEGSELLPKLEVSERLFNPIERNRNMLNEDDQCLLYVTGQNDCFIADHNNQQFKEKVAGIMNTILKDEPQYPGNQLTDHFIESACQTTTKDNPFNRRTVLGSLFEHSALLDKTNPTFEMPDSEVLVRLPDSILAPHPVEMLGSSFGSIPTILDKMRLASDEKLASPVVEYLLTGVPEMADHAVVTMPFVGKEADLRVWKFHSDDGMQTKVEPFEVPRKTKENEDVSLFYEIQGKVVKIFTKSFSGLFVTEKKHNRDQCLSLSSFLFGSFKRIENTRYEVRLILYIGDEIMKFKKYKEDMFKSEERGGRSILREMDLTLTDEVKENDVLRAMVSVQSVDWVHKLNPDMQTPILPEKQEINFCNLVSQCPECLNCHFQRRQIPYSKEWYLTNRPGTVPQDVFQCTVKVDCIHMVTPPDVKRTELVVDELRLRAVDRLPQAESYEAARLEKLQDFLNNMEDGKKERFIENIKQKIECNGDNLIEVFSMLHRTMRPVGIYESIVATLQRCQLYRELSSLQDMHILEDRYFPKPVQRTSGNEDRYFPPPATPDPVRPEQNAINPNGRQGNVDARAAPVRVRSEKSAINPKNNGDHMRAGIYHVTREYSTSRSGDGAKVSGLISIPEKVDVEREPCRNELGSDLPIGSYRRENDAVAQNWENGLPEKKHESREANGDNDDYLELTEVKQPIEQLHAQEQASLEETLRKCTSYSNSENEQN